MANMIGILAKKICDGTLTFRTEIAPITVNTVPAVKLALAEKHILRFLSKLQNFSDKNYFSEINYLSSLSNEEFQPAVHSFINSTGIPDCSIVIFVSPFASSNATWTFTFDQSPGIL